MTRRETETVSASSPSTVETGALQLLVYGEHRLDAFPLPARGNVTIGRDFDVDVHVEDGQVSREHARLHLGERIELEDIGSANGTRIGGRAIEAHQRVPLAAGEPFQLGSHILVLRPVRAPHDADAGGPGSAGLASAAIRAVYELAERVATSAINVLILGETGAGKDVLAQHVHARSPRAAAPFLRLNCASLSETLLESELFGHEKGAFTGATAAKPGLLETASGGSVFLDEVGELPPAIQAKLLHVIETRQLLRVGGLHPHAIDVRFVAATNRNLQEHIARGLFRADLYFRLAGMELTVPPLRDRLDDIVPLASWFLGRAPRQPQWSAPPTLLPETAEALVGHAWPGNVRELRNLIERAALLSADGRIGPDLLPLHRPGTPDRSAERQRVIDALNACAGNQSQAARKLGIARSTLISKIQEFRIPRPRKR